MLFEAVDFRNSSDSIAFLGAIESLLCARVADGIIGQRHDPNQELIAQGAANFVPPNSGDTKLAASP